MTTVVERDAARGATALNRNYVPPVAQSALAYNANIHYLRGLAAFLVVLGHSGYYLNDYLGIAWGRKAFPDQFGLYGVAVFFAISGYLMASLILKEKPVDFLARRIVRIYPLFIVCTLFTVFVLYPQLISRWVPLSLTLAPMDGATYLLRVEWTLVHEVFFYAAIFLIALFGLQKWIPALAAIWFCAIWAAAFFRVPMPPIGRANLLEVGIMMGNAGFAAGLLIPAVAKYVRQPFLLFAGFVGLFVSQYYLSVAYIRVIAGGACGLLLLMAIQNPITLPRVLHITLTKFGDWSYALYLIHVPIMTYVYAMYRGSEVPWFVWPTSIVCAVLAGAIFGELDQIITARAKQITKHCSSQMLTIFVTAFMLVYFAAAVYALV